MSNTSAQQIETFDIILRSAEFPHYETKLATVHCSEDQLATVVSTCQFLEARFQA